MTFPLSVDFYFYKNRSSKAKVKTGRQVIHHVECFKNTLLTFCNAPIVYDNKAGSSQFYFGIRVRLVKCQSKNNNFEKLPSLFVVTKTMTAHINDTMLILVVPAAPRRIFFAFGALNQVEMQLGNCGSSYACVGVIVTACARRTWTVRAYEHLVLTQRTHRARVLHHVRVRETAITPLPIPTK